MERLNPRNEIYMQEVEKFYRESIKDSQQMALDATDELLKEIEYYRSHTFDQIEEEERAEYMRDIQPEEQPRYEERFQERLDDKRKLDIFYDTMTQEQLNEFAKLYYMRCLRGNLLYDRVSSIRKAAESLGKKEPKSVTEEYNMAGSYVTIEAQDDYDKSKKKMIRKDLQMIATGWSIVGGVTSALAMGGTAVVALLNGDTFLEAIKMAPCLVPYILAACVFDGSIITSIICSLDKKSLRKLKEFGVYDLLIDSLKAKDEFYDYIDEIEAANGVELPEVEGGKKLR